MKASKSLVQKLAEVARGIGELEKKGDNGAYPYLRAYDVIKAVRGALLKRGVVIVPIKATADSRTPYRGLTGDIVQEVFVTVRYKITDGVESIEGEGIGVGQDYRGKALYKALTGSLKYFLQTLGLIVAVGEDPETTDEGPMKDSLTKKVADVEEKLGPDPDAAKRALRFAGIEA